ncbi:MAG: hypothetical protein AABW41_00605 [Nanoarchaeota archaeon]
MASDYECEVRFEIKDIDAFINRIITLEGSLIFDYSFYDYYLTPIDQRWNPLEKNLRIREWKYPTKPTTLYFVKNEILNIEDLKFKRAVYRAGKVPLLEGDLEECMSIAQDLGFKPWFTIRKEKAHFYEISKNKFKTIAEYIPELGWTGELEFEGQDPLKAKNRIAECISLLNIPRKSVTFKPISAIYAEKLGLL